MGKSQSLHILLNNQLDWRQILPTCWLLSLLLSHSTLFFSKLYTKAHAVLNTFINLLCSSKLIHVAHSNWTAEQIDNWIMHGSDIKENSSKLTKAGLGRSVTVCKRAQTPNRYMVWWKTIYHRKRKDQIGWF